MAPTWVTAGGTAVVGDNVTYVRNGAEITSPGEGKYATIYVPVTNPSSIVDKLGQILIEGSSDSDATITEVWVFFGTTKILDATVTDGKKGAKVVPPSDSQLPDVDPYGINVSANIYFPTAASTYTINSVGLAFGN